MESEKLLIRVDTHQSNKELDKDKVLMVFSDGTKEICDIEDFKKREFKLSEKLGEPLLIK